MRNRNKTETQPAKAGEAPTNVPDSKLHAHIGTRLRRLFDEVVEEPIPDKFRILLEDLERDELKKKSTS